MLACCVLIVVVVVEQESLRLGVLRNWFFVRFFVCFGFRVFLGFRGWVAEALCNPAQIQMPYGPAFRGSRYACRIQNDGMNIALSTSFKYSITVMVSPLPSHSHVLLEVNRVP